MKRGLLALAAALLLANLGVVIARSNHAAPAPKASDPVAAFDAALHRHDYRRAYALTDLPLLTISGASSAVTEAHFAAFVEKHSLGKPSVEQDLIHVPTTNVRVTAVTGPLPSMNVDGVGVRLLEQRLKAGGAAASWRYTYVVVVISGPHTMGVGAGPVTVGRSLAASFRGTNASLTMSLTASSDGERRVVTALDAITMGCPNNLCLVAPCSGRGGEYVLDAWGIGTPPIVSRVLVGDKVIAPMPAGGWSIAVTFLDQGQPPGLSGHEHTVQMRARYVFGFVGSSRGALLDRCWVSHS